jgi:hypothetical protein
MTAVIITAIIALGIGYVIGRAMAEGKRAEMGMHPFKMACIGAAMTIDLEAVEVKP